MADSDKKSSSEIEGDLFSLFKLLFKHWGKVVSTFGAVCALFFFGYKVGRFVSNQEHKIEINEINNKHYKEVANMRDSHAKERIDNMYNYQNSLKSANESNFRNVNEKNEREVINEN